MSPSLMIDDVPMRRLGKLRPRLPVPACACLCLPGMLMLSPLADDILRELCAYVGVCVRLRLGLTDFCSSIPLLELKLQVFGT